MNRPLRRRAQRRIAAGLALGVLLCAAAWLAATDNVAVWPARNTLQYHAVTWWWARVGSPAAGTATAGTGTLRGTVRDDQGRPIAGARVLLTQWDGTTYGAVTGQDGSYVLRDLTAGRYAAVAGAPGHGDERLVSGRRALPAWLLPWQPGGVTVAPGGETHLNTTLSPAAPVRVEPGKALTLSAPEAISCQVPVESRAARRRLTFDSGGSPNQSTLLYTPETPATGGDNGGAIGSTGSPLPVLLTVYPGTADEWECASLPLAAAGYAVIAAGPAYSFELERDVDELVRLLGFARTGQLPGADGRRIAVLGGSYSGLHVLRLLQRERGIAAALLLGAPSDLFDMRRRFEQGTFIPPFGLDQALIALGFPDREPLRYWRYSGAYHVHAAMPPTLLIHSRSDDVVPYQQGELLASALAQAGVPHALHLLEGASHYLLSADADAFTIYRLTLDFLSRLASS